MAVFSPAAGRVSNRQRLNERETWGDLQSMFDQAIAEHSAGRLENAAAGFRGVLVEWLRQLWVEKHGCQDRGVLKDPVHLQKKLRMSGAIDDWTARIVYSALVLPVRDCRWQHVDILAGAVSAICFDRPIIRQGALAASDSQKAW